MQSLQNVSVLFSVSVFFFFSIFARAITKITDFQFPPVVKLSVTDSGANPTDF